MKARILQIELVVLVGSRFQPANIREGKPISIDMRSTMDEIRRSKAHGFERSIRFDRTKQLRILPTEPKIKIKDAKHRSICSEMCRNESIILLSVIDAILKNWNVFL